MYAVGAQERPGRDRYRGAAVTTAGSTPLHSSERSPGARRKRLLIAFGIATVVFDLVLVLLDRRLVATGGPSILGLEFAGSQHRLDQIVEEWGTHGVHLARLSLWLDFGFMLSYGTFFTLAGLATAAAARERGLRRLAACGRVAPFLAAAAALFDAAENITWLVLLDGHDSSFLPALGTACAAVKFFLIGVAMVYAACGLIVWLRFRTSKA